MKVDRLVVVRHVPFEGPAAIAAWATSRGLDVVDVMMTELPEVRANDLLVSMGGPMSVNDDDAWIAEEQALIRQHLLTGGAFVGVCLGAQQLAAAFGGSVAPAVDEHGWLPVHATQAGLDFGLPKTFVPFHWHGEACTLPPDATLLASTDACEAQVFTLGPRAIGLQCHLEAGLETVDALLDHCGTDLHGGEHQQSAEAMRDETPDRVAAVRPILDHMLATISRTDR